MPLARSSVRWSLPLPSPAAPLRSVGKAVEGRRAFTYCGRNMAASAPPAPLRATTTISEGGRGGERRNEEDNRDGDGGSAMMRKEMKRGREMIRHAASLRGAGAGWRSLGP